MWKYNTKSCNDASPAIADVDGDGNLEVIISASATSIVYCFDGATGNMKWTASTGYGYSIDSPAAIADVDSDGKAEVILGTFWGFVYVFNGEDGSLLWSKRFDPESCIQSEPLILDLDKDGDLDIVITQFLGLHRVYALDGKDGTTIWFSEEPKGDMYHNGSFADFDRDGDYEIVIGSYDGFLYFLNAMDGSLIWKKNLGKYIAAPTAIADFQKDGKIEIVVAADNTIYVLSENGEILWIYDTGGSIFRGASISDIDGDGFLDIVIGSNDGKLYGKRGKDGIPLFTFSTQGWAVENAPVIADFNGDNFLDIFIISGKSYNNQSKNWAIGYALSFGPGMSPGWYMFKNDLTHSGFFKTVEGINYRYLPSPPNSLK